MVQFSCLGYRVGAKARFVYGGLDNYRLRHKPRFTFTEIAMGMFGGKPLSRPGGNGGQVPATEDVLANAHALAARLRGDAFDPEPVAKIMGPLSEIEKADLADDEAAIEEGRDHFVKVGKALLDIRERQLYRDTHGTFEAYCQDRWDFHRAQAYRLMDAASVVDNLKAAGLKPPENEAQARELAKLSDPDQVLIWKATAEAAQKTGGKATAGILKDMAETLREIRDTGHLTINEELQLPASKLFDESLQVRAVERMERQETHKFVARKKKREERLETIRIASSLSDLQKLYPVIYADPPWRYEHSKTHSRDIENQYPTMPLDEICALPVKDMTTEHAILFMWATAPKLEEAMQVIRAWGFTYRTCMVWDKEHMGMGYWTRVQHELLLIAVKGEFPVPEEENRVRSVYREARGEHSAKPDYYRDLIERMYPDMGRIELFARQSDRPDLWDVWGNEVERIQ